jgi:hypothetical protein
MAAARQLRCSEALPLARSALAARSALSQYSNTRTAFLRAGFYCFLSAFSNGPI